MMNRKSYTGFPTSYRWSAYVTSQSPKGWLKKRIFSFFEQNSTSIEWSLLQSFFDRNFQQQGFSTIIPLSNGP